MKNNIIIASLLAASCGISYAQSSSEGSDLSFFNIGPDAGASAKADGSDLLSNISSGNTDYAVLGFADKQHQTATTADEKYPKARLTLSGGLVAVAQKDMNHNIPDTETISKADFNALFEAFSFINVYGSTEIGTQDNLKFKDGFVTFGDLQASPLYLTVGRYNIPFGSYPSNIISSIEPNSVALGSIHADNINFGYHPDKPTAFVANGYVYKQTVVLAKKDNPGYGAHLGFNDTVGQINGSVSVSYVSDIADSGGISDLYSSQAKLGNQVPGAAASFNIAYKNYGVFTGYVSAARSFSKSDMTYNNKKALPSALHLEAYYNGRVFDKLNNAAVGVTDTFDALAIGLPQQRIYVADTINVLKNFNVGAEVDFDKNYSKNTSATYATNNVSQDGQTHIGGYLQLGYYF